MDSKLVNVHIPTAEEMDSTVIKSRPNSSSQVTDNQKKASSMSQPTRPNIVPPLQMGDKSKKKYVGAARKIERYWTAHRNRQMFYLLKTAICAAEHSLTQEIIRKIAPNEAGFFKDDNSSQLKIKFRFGGSEFPPNVYFKIFLVGDKCRSKYVTGKKTIDLQSDAAYDALKNMGHRNYYNLMIQDQILQTQHHVVDEADVVTMKDYMQYLSLLDESPADIGGKCNDWRHLGLQGLPRQTIFYDVFAYLSHRRVSPRLRAAWPLLVARPSDPHALRAQLDLLSRVHPCEPPRVPQAQPDSMASTTRRSRQSRQRVEKMRQMYAKQRDIPTCDPPDVPPGTENVTFRDNEAGVTPVEMDPMEEEWEREAGLLYQWTRELTIEDITGYTPRVNSVPYSRRHPHL